MLVIHLSASHKRSEWCCEEFLIVAIRKVQATFGVAMSTLLVGRMIVLRATRYKQFKTVAIAGQSVAEDATPIAVAMVGRFAMP
jgi:hypothetical protein